ncbi:MAG: hypothetical protein LBC20_00600 [Planctomycetaceae bacterium]|nr:hypothetical protein [Planctomycetaceae bacterium]
MTGRHLADEVVETAIELISPGGVRQLIICNISVESSSICLPMLSKGSQRFAETF